MDSEDQQRIGKSITSNIDKLVSAHSDSLESLANGKPAPILLHTSLTNACDAKCGHCCFSERDKSLAMPFDLFKNTLEQFVYLGLKSVEFTGGGEPTMYRDPTSGATMNDAIEYVVNDMGLALGMNTNALNPYRVTSDNWSKFDWVRVAFNIFDGGNLSDISKFRDNVSYINDLTNMTACYIVPQDVGLKNLDQVISFANEIKVPTRIAPDCIQSREEISELTKKIKERINTNHPDNQYALLSDFNIYLFDRPNDVCATHAIKPFLYTDGFVYTCPSSELAPENGRTMQERFRVCHGSEVSEKFKDFEPKTETCSYCKYAAQNTLIDEILRTGDVKAAYTATHMKSDPNANAEANYEKAMKTKFNDSKFA